jgi:HK97 family phage major capsid protein
VELLENPTKEKQMTQVNVRELSLLLQEASALSNKPNWTKQDERRNAYLLAAISAAKAGVPLIEIDEQHLNEAERRNGLKPTRLKKPWGLTTEQRGKAEFMQRLLRCTDGEGIFGHEFRDGEVGGAILPRLGTYSGLGFFVPTEMYGEIFDTMAWHDPLYDEDVCTVIKSTNGRPLTVPTYDDIANVAVQVGEASADAGEVLLGQPNHVVLAGYSFRTPIQKYSIEIEQDLSESFTAYSIFQRMASDRLARGIGKKLILGAGGGTEPTGIVTALAAAGVTPIIAAGRGANTGIGGDTGVNSIGSTDLADLYYSVNEAWRVQPKTGWLMNDTTLTGLMGMVTKMGLPLVDFRTGVPYILNKPVHVCPSMQSPGSGNVPVIFGDLGQWATRLIAQDGNIDKVMVYRERYAEFGQVGLQMFVRADGNLLFTGSGADTPLNYIQSHS